METIRNTFPGSEIIICSSKNGDGLDTLLASLRKKIEMEASIEVTLANEPPSQSILSTIFNSCQVVSVHYADKIELQAKCHRSNVGRIQKMVEEAGGRLTSDAPQIEKDVPTEM